MPAYQFNAEQFNSDHFLSGALTQDDVVFNDYSLMSFFGTWYGLAVQTANYFDLTNINIAQFISEQIDWGGIEQKKYGNRSLNISLYIQGSSYSDLVSRIEALKQRTRWVSASLDVRVNGVVRSYEATVASIIFPRFNMLEDYVQWVSVEFLITSPHWSSKVPTIESTSGIVWSFEKVIFNEGTYEAFPKLYFIMWASWNAITAMNIVSKSIGEVSGYDVTLTTAITNNDVVIFDYKEKTVTVNWVEVAWSWFMTPMKDGFHVLTVTLTGTASLSNFIVYNPVFL